MALPWGISHCYSPLHCYNSAHTLLCCNYLVNNPTFAQIWGKFIMSLAFWLQFLSLLRVSIVLLVTAWLRLRLGYDIIKPFSDKTSGKFAIQVQSVWGCRKWQNTELSLSLKSPASEDRPRRSRSFNLNIDSVELISSNSSSSLRRRNAHSNDDMNSLSISISHNHLKASIFHHSINYAACCFISKWFKMHCVTFKNIIAKKDSYWNIFSYLISLSKKPAKDTAIW